MLAPALTEEGSIGWGVDTVTALKLSGVIDQNVFIPFWLGKIVLKGHRTQSHGKQRVASRRGPFSWRMS